MNEFNQTPVPATGRPQLGFVEAIKICLTEKYCDFNGRARRSEYWWFCLGNMIVSYLGGFIGGMLGTTAYYIILAVICLALLLPGLGVMVRRLHDIGKSGWLVLLSFIPLVGAIILIVWCCKDSDRGQNQYGPSPKYQ